MPSCGSTTARAAGATSGGSVTVVVGGTRWQTSLFPEKRSGSFVLPVKQQVRRENDLIPGDVVSVRLDVG